MIYKRIEYSKNFNIIGTIHEKMVIDAELEDGDNPDECFLELKARVHKWADQKGFTVDERPKNSLPDWKGNFTEPDLKPEKPMSANDRIKQQIAQCSDVKVLESFKLLASKNTELLLAYNARHAELSQPQKQTA